MVLPNHKSHFSHCLQIRGLSKNSTCAKRRYTTLALTDRSGGDCPSSRPAAPAPQPADGGVSPHGSRFQPQEEVVPQRLMKK